jgi:hypothetical protein
MSFTRFHDDPARIRKHVEDSTFAERYHLNTPGNGNNMPLQMDPQLRLQRWVQICIQMPLNWKAISVD